MGMISSLGKVAVLFSGVMWRRGPLHTLDILFTSGMAKLFGPRLYKIPARKSELMYWEKQLIGIGQFSDVMELRVNKNRQRELFPEEVIPLLNKLRGESTGKPKVLDVGPGPISLLTWGYYAGILELVTADPLNNQYDELLSIYGYEGAREGINNINTPCEILDSFVDYESMDAVFCNNALDHTVSPRICLEKMLYAVREGGYIIISGRSREGSYQGWDDIHQHDLYIQDNTLWHADRYGVQAPLTVGLPLVTLSLHVADGPYGKMSIVLKKEGSRFH